MRASSAEADMRHQPAALRDDRDRRVAADLDLRLRRRADEVDPQPIDGIGIAEAIRAEQGDAAFAGDVGQLTSCELAFADLGEARREDDGRSHLAAHASRHGLVHAGRRQCEDREIDALRQVVDARQHGPALDGAAAAAHEMNVAAEIVEREIAEDEVAGGAGLARHADDRDRTWPHQLLDTGDAAGSVPLLIEFTFLIYSGSNISRCVPFASGVQNGLTRRPIFSRSRVQRTILAITFTPSSSVTRPIANGS